jgi:hypothetical protein
VDDGEAYEGYDPEPGKTRRFPRGREYEGLLVRLQCEATVAGE